MRNSKLSMRLNDTQAIYGAPTYNDLTSRNKPRRNGHSIVTSLATAGIGTSVGAVLHGERDSRPCASYTMLDADPEPRLSNKTVVPTHNNAIPCHSSKVTSGRSLNSKLIRRRGCARCPVHNSRCLHLYLARRVLSVVILGIITMLTGTIQYFSKLIFSNS
ncbi:hypothetical protein BU24DRAFT_58763 [Aaosphaeria arxii CBS 175.79]|uniref:Uncharacterized protein n=1 Tax=Aaosphaeria arxii CBS 175.79 TaxID=1450172 RepID=A0A6A5XCF3_9PLEO|nr:uncharacterized protein BU24DRAFT_58763 [Aaosphaeria arxii CBS 175.79]KAF2010454.1 hypothetical protein BU24DRAFT_58763 [Aaosphaeria arxii CBS 175.79]